jgi:hypothetical protein
VPVSQGTSSISLYLALWSGEFCFVSKDLTRVRDTLTENYEINYIEILFRSVVTSGLIESGKSLPSVSLIPLCSMMSPKILPRHRYCYIGMLWAVIEPPAFKQSEYTWSTDAKSLAKRYLKLKFEARLQFEARSPSLQYKRCSLPIGLTYHHHGSRYLDSKRKKLTRDDEPILYLEYVPDVAPAAVFAVLFGLLFLCHLICFIQSKHMLFWLWMLLGLAGIRNHIPS